MSKSVIPDLARRARILIMCNEKKDKSSTILYKDQIIMENVVQWSMIKGGFKQKVDKDSIHWEDYIPSEYFRHLIFPFYVGHSDEGIIRILNTDLQSHQPW